MSALDCQGAFVVICPALVIEITPPQVHMHVEVLVKAGLLAIMTVGEPGVQGEVVTGTHGAGVGVPSAAAVAAATAGFDCVIHIPKVMMFFIGTKSMIVAAGRLEADTRFSGVTTRLEGATPNEHWSMAPIHTI